MCEEACYGTRVQPRNGFAAEGQDHCLLGQHICSAGVRRTDAEADDLRRNLTSGANTSALQVQAQLRRIALSWPPNGVLSIVTLPPASTPPLAHI